MTLLLLPMGERSPQNRPFTSITGTTAPLRLITPRRNAGIWGYHRDPGVLNDLAHVANIDGKNFTTGLESQALQTGRVAYGLLGINRFCFHTLAISLAS